MFSVIRSNGKWWIARKVGKTWHFINSHETRAKAVEIINKVVADILATPRPLQHLFPQATRNPFHERYFR